MILKRHVLALLALGFGLGVGACAQVSGTVSDAWPHWAGGEPANSPPRPGAPGYQDFIAHRQASTTAEQQQSPSATGSPTAQPVPVAAANPAPRPQGQPPAHPSSQSPPQAPAQVPVQVPSQDTTIARGNLY